MYVLIYYTHILLTSILYDLFHINNGARTGAEIVTSLFQIQYSIKFPQYTLPHRVESCWGGYNQIFAHSLNLNTVKFGWLLSEMSPLSFPILWTENTFYRGSRRTLFVSQKTPICKLDSLSLSRVSWAEPPDWRRCQVLNHLGWLMSDQISKAAPVKIWWQRFRYS